MAAMRDWLVYDRTELQAALGPRDGESIEALIALDGMHCAACAARAERLLADKVSRVSANLSARTLSFRWQPAQIAISAVLRLLDEAGLDPRVLAYEDQAERQARTRRRTLLQLGIATICAMQVMMLAWPGYIGATLDPGLAQLMRWAQWIVATPGVLWAGWPFFAGAARALRARSLNMDVPVALALAVAYSASALRTLRGTGDLYFDTATMFVCLLLLGRFLEQRTRALAGERLRLLAGRRALTAQRRTAAGVETIPIAALALGDVVIVAPGEALPADGVLLESATELDEALLTGESRPVPHRAGEEVLAGSLNLGDSPLALRITRSGADSTLARITQLLDGAQQHKPAAQRIADRYAGHFVLAVMLIAAAAFALTLERGFDHALAISLTVLVASCPCALSLAMPIVLAAATSRLAAGGVLVANADALTRLADADTVLFDKTGTLTLPQLRLKLTVPCADIPADECRTIAAALERDSPHPIAGAFAPFTMPPGAENIRHIPGAGIDGTIAGRRYSIGRAERAPPQVRLPRAPTEGAAATWIVLTDARRALAWFALDAEPRAEARDSLQALRELGLDMEILSGDSTDATAALAQSLLVPRFRARQSAAEKLARVRELQAHGARLLAVGDGLNDAPLLAAAGVSAAMPQGAALTQARADLVLVGDSLAGLALAIRVARAARQRMRENLAWALAYNLAVLPLAVSGVLAPWMAAAGMSTSSLLVAANALRLGRPTSKPAVETGMQLHKAMAR